MNCLLFALNCTACILQNCTFGIHNNGTACSDSPWDFEGAWVSVISPEDSFLCPEPEVKVEENKGGLSLWHKIGFSFTLTISTAVFLFMVWKHRAAIMECCSHFVGWTRMARNWLGERREQFRGIGGRVENYINRRRQRRNQTPTPPPRRSSSRESPPLMTMHEFLELPTTQANRQDSGASSSTGFANPLYEGATTSAYPKRDRKKKQDNDFLYY